MLVSLDIAREVSGATKSMDAAEAGSVPALAALPDGQLLRRYLQGREEAAFTQLVSRFSSLVFAVGLRLLHDHHAAEDVFQATFLVLARDARRIRSPESVSSWLHATALRLAKRALARRRREVTLENVMPLVDGQSLFDEISRRFEQQLVDEELQRLPAAYRAPLVLHVLEGKTCEETAAALGTSVGAVRGRLDRGKRELKLRLMKRGVEFPSAMAALAMWQAAAEAAVQPPLLAAAVQGGMAITQGTSIPAVCSPEAIHLAAKETAMFTMGKLLVSSAALLSTAALGWFAHGASAGNESVRPPALPTALELLQQLHVEGELDLLNRFDQPEVVTLRVEETLAFAGANDAAGADTDAEDADDADENGKSQLVLKYGDGKPDGKKSIAGTGEMIRFTLRDPAQKLRSLRIHCARYGYPQAPDEDAEITIVSEDGADIVHTEFVPYATFKRGESRWTTIRFKEPVTVPKTFWVILQFNAERTKGVYVSYDSSTGGEHSRTGLPGTTPKELTFEGDWMVQAVLTEPE